MLLAVALLAGNSMAWAGDFNGTNSSSYVTVPGAFDLSYGSYTEFNRNDFFSDANKIEYSKKDCEAIFRFTVSVAGVYVFSLEASNGNTYGDFPAILTVKIYGESESEPSDATFAINVPDDNNWNNFVGYLYSTSELSNGNYILKISWSDQANVQNIRMTSTSSFKEIPTSSFDISTGGTFVGKGNYDSSKGLDSFKDGYYVTYLVYNSVANNVLNMSFDAATPRTDASLKVDFSNGATTATATKTITSNGSDWTTTIAHDVDLNTTLPVGYYVMKITMNSSSGNYTANVKNIAFRQKAALNEGSDYASVAGYADVTLTRSITAGKWSTIVLPFAMTNAQLTTTFGNDVKVAELTSGDATTLNFSTVTGMVANQPYAIKVANNFSSANINGVTIVNGTPTQNISNWDFVGTYSNGTIAADNNYYFKSNKLYKAGGSGTTSIKPFRAYLHYTGSAPAPAPTFTIDGDLTGIAHISTDGQMNLEEGAVYNLAGQRVSQPKKGMYIVNGKKIIIK